jgi:hypothetical protein
MDEPYALIEQVAHALRHQVEALWDPADASVPRLLAWRGDNYEALIQGCAADLARTKGWWTSSWEVRYRAGGRWPYSDGAVVDGDACILLEIKHRQAQDPGDEIISASRIAKAARQLRDDAMKLSGADLDDTKRAAAERPPQFPHDEWWEVVRGLRDWQGLCILSMHGQASSDELARQVDGQLHSLRVEGLVPLEVGTLDVADGLGHAGCLRMFRLDISCGTSAELASRTVAAAFAPPVPGVSEVAVGNLIRAVRPGRASSRKYRVRDIGGGRISLVELYHDRQRGEWRQERGTYSHGLDELSDVIVLRMVAPRDGEPYDG